MLKILKYVNVGFSRYPYFKVEICIEFAVNLHCSKLNSQSRLRFSKANALQFTAEIWDKVGISRKAYICVF